MLVDTTLRIPELLERRAAEDGDFLYCRFSGGSLTVRQLKAGVDRLYNGLLGLGIRSGDRIAVMLGNHSDHVMTVLALIKLGAVWIPVNLQLRGPSLSYLLAHAEPTALIAEGQAREALEMAFATRRPPVVIWHGEEPSGGGGEFAFSVLTEVPETPYSAAPLTAEGDNDLTCIVYTSGTTGAPKGVMVTDRMLQVAAIGAILSTEPRDGDVLLLWEPLYHIGGIQMIFVGLMRRVTLALVERFSASRFWDQTREYGATHIHHLGGILQILLKQPPDPCDRDNPVRISWGGGCTSEAWTLFERRFGVHIHEVYGMTEASSISTLNTEGRVGSVGRAASYFDVRLLDEAGSPVSAGALGEIVIAERESGLLTKGYFRNPEATAKALQGGVLHTGDLAWADEDGFLYYSGRTRDSVRYRGENVSAWEVERIINGHPDVEESALVGVKTDIGEQDLKIFIKLRAGSVPDPAGLIRWCAWHMAPFQVPRYVAFVDQFEKTPSLRVRKTVLSLATDDCWDATANR